MRRLLPYTDSVRHVSWLAHVLKTCLLMIINQLAMVIIIICKIIGSLVCGNILWGASRIVTCAGLTSFGLLMLCMTRRNWVAFVWQSICNRQCIINALASNHFVACCHAALERMRWCNTLRRSAQDNVDPYSPMKIYLYGIGEFCLCIQCSQSSFMTMSRI